MEKKQKGRPPKGERIAKKEHFSVWVSKEQKELISDKVQRSGLSASQYFLTQVLDTPIKRPQLKVLPEKTAELYKVLRMLSGQFAVAVLRASHADMISRQWQESSQNISLISKLIMQWVYEDFEVRSFRQTLTDINEHMKQLYSYLERMLPAGHSKTTMLEITARLYHKSGELLKKYEAHYLIEETPKHLAVWQSEKPETVKPLHDVIKETVEELLKQKKALIGKVGLGKYAKGILAYCYYDKQLTAKQIRELGPGDVRGELVYIQNLALQKLPDGRFDINNLSKQFLDNSGKNRKLTKFIWHQSFSFPPGENPGNEKITEIALQFAKDFGFEDNQMAVFLHTDTSNKHFHIVANRINYNGKNTADHFKNYARVGKFCRKMELQLGLQITPEMHLTAENKQQPRQTVDQALLKLKQAIDSILPNVSSVQQFGTEMKKLGVKTLVKRGITFIHTQNGMKVKGSDIGREYSLANLEKRLGVAQEMQESKSEDLSQAKQRRKGLSI